MNQISCNRCGVVLNRNKLAFPYIYLDDGSVDTEKAIWDGDDYVPFVKCPVCAEPVMDLTEFQRENE